MSWLSNNSITWGLNVFLFVFTTAAVVLLSWSVLDDYLPVRKSLHAFENTHGHANMNFPHSYPTLDWIMTPELRADGLPNTLMVQEVCYQDERFDTTNTDVKNCAPEYWQTTKFCPYPHQTHTEWENYFNLNVSGMTFTDFEKHLAYDEKEKNLGPYPCTSDTSKICYALPQVRDACRVERLGQFSVMSNDATSWSLAAGHNADVLYQGAGVLLWLISGFHIINSWFKVTSEIVTKNEYVIEERFEKQKMYKRLLGLIAVLYFVITRSFFTAHDAVQNNKIYVHLLPNASYFYILISIIWITIFGSMDNVFCHMQQILRAKMGQNSVHVPLAVPVEEYDDGAPPAKPGMFEKSFDLSNFSSGKKLDAYLPRLAPLRGSGTDLGNPMEAYDTDKVVKSRDFEFDNELLDNSCVKFEVVQLFTLPLLLLAITVRYNSWEIDSKLQLLYLAGFGYALFDVARNRVHYTCKVFDRLINKSTYLKDGSRVLDDVGKDTVKGAMRIIELLCILLQLLVFFVIFNTWIEHIADRRAVVVLPHDSGRERHMDASIWSFLVYAVLAFLIKLIQVWAPMQKGQYIHNKNILYALFGLFVLFSLFNAVFLRDKQSIFDESRNVISKEFYAQMNTNNKLLMFDYYGKWSNSWMQVNA